MLLNTIDAISHAFIHHLQKMFSLEDIETQELEVSLNVDPNKQQFGDLTTNAAMVLAKKAGAAPRLIAEKITSSFSHPAVQKAEIAGPGFINLYLKNDAFIAASKELFHEKKAFFMLPANAKKQRINLEFVSANPTGPLHFGHGRGGIIGDVLGNILRFLGHDVVKEFVINDAGSQITKLGDSFKIRYLQATGHTAELPEEGYHGEYLVTLAQQLLHEKGDALQQESVAFFAQYAKEHLLRAIQETLGAHYGILFDVWFSEKTLHDNGAVAQAIDELNQRGYIYEQEGALWFRSTAFGDDKDRVVKRASGEVTYVAADIAYLKNKINRGFDKLIMVLGQDHHSYVTRLKAVMQAFGYQPERLHVILYQLVTIKEDGQALRLSKRAGRIITLDDIIETVGKDVARFFYLHRKADAHLDFDLELALKHTDENPVYYLQYALVRTKSMLQKAGEDPAFGALTATDADGLTSSEHLLLKKIFSLKQVLRSIERTHQPHTLTYYVLELAALFHRYYAEHRVIDQQNVALTRARLVLIEELKQTFTLCLQLLGVNCPDVM